MSTVSLAWNNTPLNTNPSKDNRVIRYIYELRRVEAQSKIGLQHPLAVRKRRRLGRTEYIEQIVLAVKMA